MHGARAAIAGAFAMLFGIWVIERVSGDAPAPEELVSGAVVLLIIVLLLLGIDPRQNKRDE